MPEQAVQPELSPYKKTAGLESEKVIGYFLLLMGILIIVFATFFALRVFSGKSEPYKVFEVQAPSIKIPSPSVDFDIPEGVDLPPGFSLNQQAASESEVKILPDEVFNSLLNIGVFYLAMMFLASSGAKLADMGIKMVKDIKVHIKQDKIGS
jgi:hypothetical protein